MSEALPPQGWRLVGELFHRALDLPEDERIAFAERELQSDPVALQELKSLIDSDRKVAAGFVADRVKAGILAFAQPPTLAETRIGPYLLVRLIGRGGMGSVYLGQRDDAQYTMQVAVKVVSPGMDTEFVLKRFRRERQTLANLQHPNIARLLDGGTTPQDLPYIVMEFVDGLHINEYCRVHQLSIEQRLRLFLPVCDAVTHAHRSFVVHRDIKPGNILVDKSGTPKLLDFGICKLLYSEASSPDQTIDQGARMMTPDYASPEQMRGETATIASDVYSLGAVLYELLSEAKPHRFANYSIQEMERVICEEEPLKPSAVASNRYDARRLSGDLDTIVLRALAKDPARRYHSVEDLAGDLRRYLSHDPVLARPDTLGYRARKFLRRRAGFVAAAATILAVLLGGILVANHEARLAEERFQQVRKLANVFVSDVHDAVRPLPGSTRARELILRTGVQYLDALASSAGSDLDLQAELAASYIKIGDLQGDDANANLGQIEAALVNYGKAQKLLDAAIARNPSNRQIRLERFILDFQTGRLRYIQRDRNGALAAFRQAAAAGERLLQENSSDEDVRERLAQTYIETGLVYRSTGEAGPNLEALTKATSLLDGAPTSRKSEAAFEFLAASATSQRGFAEVMAGKTADGLSHLRTAAGRLDALRARVPENTDYARQAMITWSHNADCLFDQKDVAGARAAGERFVAIARQLHLADAADDRAATDYAIASMKVSAYLPESDAAGRVLLLRPAVAALRERVAANPKNAQSVVFLAAAEVRLADALRQQNNLAEAALFWSAAILHAQPLVPSGQLSPAEIVVMASQRLGELAAARGASKEAEQYLAGAWRIADPGGEFASKRSPVQQQFLTARGELAVGLLHARLGERDAALDWLRKSDALWRELKSNPMYNPTYQRLADAVQTELAHLTAAAKRKAQVP